MAEETAVTEAVSGNAAEAAVAMERRSKTIDDIPCSSTPPPGNAKNAAQPNGTTAGLSSIS